MIHHMAIGDSIDNIIISVHDTQNLTRVLQR